jgi:hypothetical protein
MTMNRVLRWTVSGKYIVDDEVAQENYGTLDAEEIVKLDLENLRDDPASFLDGADHFSVVVERNPLR